MTWLNWLVSGSWLAGKVLEAFARLRKAGGWQQAKWQVMSAVGMGMVLGFEGLVIRTTWGLEVLAALGFLMVILGWRAFWKTWRPTQQG